MSEKLKKFYVTTPIYYVNASPHIGHAYTTIVADVLARFYRRELGYDNVYFLTGTDEHGAKLAEAADKHKVEPQAYVDKISEEFKTAWKDLDISNNDFIRTTDNHHKKIVLDILAELKSAKTPLGNDVLYEADYEGLYCVGCEKFILPSECVDGKCPLHNSVPQLLKEKNWFFRLQDFLPAIKKLIESDELLVYPATRKNEVLGLIDKQNLPDFSISRSIKSVQWGIDLPWDKSQKVYVWVDALSNYITALGYPDGKLYKKFWPAEVQLMALEILKFHTLYWPAMLLAIKAPLPKGLYIHGFFTIDGQKMSKTLGNVIAPQELIAKYGADATKYLILSQFSFGAESDIRVEDFPNKYNADLVNGLGNMVSRVTNMIEQYTDGVADITKDLSNTKVVGNYIEKFKFREALQAVFSHIAEVNSIIDFAKPWEMFKKGQKKDLKKKLNQLASYIYDIANALEPFMPNTSAKIMEIITAKKIRKPSEQLFPRHQ